MSKYNPKPGSDITKDQAERIGVECERLSREHGHVTPRILLDSAAPKDSLLHSLFEWNNRSAGDAWRLHQARVYIQSVEEIVVLERPPARSFLSIKLEESDRQYEPVRKVLVHDDKLASVSRQLYGCLVGYARRARSLGLDQSDAAWLRIVQAIEANTPSSVRLDTGGDGNGEARVPVRKAARSSRKAS